MDVHTMDGGRWIGPGVYLTAEDAERMDREDALREQAEIEDEMQRRYEEERSGSYCHLD